MMGEISYKISQLCLGIGSCARILNKPYSTPSGRFLTWRSRKKPPAFNSQILLHIVMLWVDFGQKYSNILLKNEKNWSRYVCVRYFSLQTVRERLPNPILNGAGKKTTKERTKQMCSPPITCILNTIRNNIFPGRKNKTNDFMIIIETC